MPLYVMTMSVCLSVALSPESGCSAHRAATTKGVTDVYCPLKTSQLPPVPPPPSLVKFMLAVGLLVVLISALHLLLTDHFFEVSISYQHLISLCVPTLSLLCCCPMLSIAVFSFLLYVAEIPPFRGLCLVSSVNVNSKFFFAILLE